MSIKQLQEWTRISKYARYLPEKQRREHWPEQIKRVMNMHREKYRDILDDIKEELEIAEDGMRKKLVLGSQRALQFGGPAILNKEARLYNCTVSYIDRPKFFQECMWLLLCGCGVGFSVQHHHIEKLPTISRINKENITHHVIEDSIEGWADAVGLLLSSYFDYNQPFPEVYGQYVTFDYSQIRPEGSTISHTGGKAPGPDPLRRGIEKIRNLIEERLNHSNKLRPIDCYDIVMHSSDAVLAGGVRRSATICMFSKEDNEMLTAKTGNWSTINPQRARSNNSVLLLRDETTEEEFKNIMKSVKEFGEPGFVWADDKESLFNPCVEIGMYAYDEYGNSGWSFCNLCEINVKKAKTKEEFLHMCKVGAILGTLQAGYNKFNYLGEVTERIVRREALLGVSMTGMQDNPDISFDPEIQREGAEIIKKVNKEFSAKIGINQSARTTCVKPAGCLLPNTEIKTNKGIMSLEDIINYNGYDLNSYKDKSNLWLDLTKSDIKIYNENNQLEDITKIYINGLSDVYEFPLEDGTIIKCTAEHKFKLTNGNWKRADQLNDGDDILVF